MTTYKPFGTPVGASSGQKFRYAGELYDASTGLYYVCARCMDPELGRFVSLDPELGRLSAPQTLDRYVYCANNPLRFTDPTGAMTNARPYSHKYAQERPGSLDEAMFWIGFIPYVDTLSDVYFLIRAVQEGDWTTAVIIIGCTALPVGYSYIKGGKLAARYVDDVVRHADDVPTPKPPSGLRSADEVDDLVTMRHYTDTATARKIEATGYLRKDSWVGPSGQIKPGMTQNEITDLLALPSPSRAECYIDVQVHMSDLYIDPVQGLKAQPLFGGKGGGFQYRLSHPISIGNARFLPTFWG